MNKSAIPIVILAILTAVFAWFTLTDEVELLLNSSSETSTITSCAVNTFDAGKLGVGREDKQFAVQAIVESGNVVTGSFIHPTLGLCEKRLYREVTVLVHEADESRSRILSFYDFWLVPFLFLVVFTVLIILALKEQSDDNKFRYAVQMIMVAAFVVLLGNYWVGYETAREFKTLGIDNGRLEEGHSDESESESESESSSVDQTD